MAGKGEMRERKDSGGEKGGKRVREREFGTPVV